MDTVNNRLGEAAAMLMIGDGALGLMYPREHCLLWRGGPGWWRGTIEWFAAHPEVTRAFAVAEVAAGLWLARREESMPPVLE
jgi:hypothetical protein